MKLSDLGTLFDGPHATPKRREIGPYFLNIASLNNGRLDLDQSDHVSEEEFQQWTRRTTPEAGDLLFSYETRLGEAALMPDGVRACLGRRMALLRPDRSRVDPRFLLYWYLSPATKMLIDKNTVLGATVPRILLSEMPDWAVSIPRLADQQAIAAVLGALDDKIIANSRLVAISTDLAAAVTRRSLVSARNVHLSSIADVTMGSSPKGSTYNETASGIVLYQGMRDFGVRFPTPRVFTTEPVRMAKNGDILMSVRAPVGSLNLADRDCCIGRGLAALRSQAPVALYHLLLNQPELFASFNTDGTIFGSINKHQLNSLPIRTPARGLADLESALAPIENRVAAAIYESQALAELRDTLLPALMDGRIRVRDAIEQAETVL